jgi:3-mercaptopyruvate sulfurtransferase SseA
MSSRGGGGIILDVRAEDYYAGKKSEEARAGHIPGAINRPFTEDVTKQDAVSRFKPSSELVAAYAGLIPSREAKVIVHCRTGHQASQTFFVLKNLLGYTNVLYYDAGWTEWAARPHLPVETGP